MTLLIVAAVVLGGALACSAPFALRYLRLLEERSARKDVVFPRLEGFFYLNKVRSVAELGAVRLSEEGVRLANYGPDLGLRRNPVTAAQFALSLVPHLHDARARTLLRANLDYLMDEGVRTAESNLVFPYDFDWPWRGETAPWYSSMAQGQAASALLWGCRTFGESRYADAARRAILAMIENSPVRFSVPVKGGVWLKEYPGYGYDVLDGSLAAIAGVYDVWRSLDSSDPDRDRIGGLLTAAISGFKNSFERFESTTWGHYYSDRCSASAAGKYTATLAWLDYLATYDPDLRTLRKRATVEPRGRIANLVRIYGWGAKFVAHRIVDCIVPRPSRRDAR